MWIFCTFDAVVHWCEQWMAIPLADAFSCHQETESAAGSNGELVTSRAI